MLMIVLTVLKWRGISNTTNGGAVRFLLLLKGAPGAPSVDNESIKRALITIVFTQFRFDTNFI
jgi:hypothetical protein